MKSVNKSIDITKVDERLMVELEGRKEMSNKISACAANAVANACGGQK